MTGTGERPAADLAATDSHIALVVNGVTHHIEIDNRCTLLDVLHDELDLTGSKRGCDHVSAARAP